MNLLCVSAYHYTKIDIQITKTLCATQLKAKSYTFQNFRINCFVEAIDGGNLRFEFKYQLHCILHVSGVNEWMNEWYHVGGNNSQTFSFCSVFNFYWCTHNSIGLHFLHFFLFRIIFFRISEILNTQKERFDICLSLRLQSERYICIYSFSFMFHRFNLKKMSF